MNRADIFVTSIPLEVTKLCTELRAYDNSGYIMHLTIYLMRLFRVIHYFGIFPIVLLYCDTCHLLT